MFIRLQMLGNGTAEDPHRVDLPTYSMIEQNDAAGWMTVSVPYRDQPPSFPPAGSPLYPFIGTAFILVGLSQDQLNAWWARLNARYPGRVDAITPRFV